MNRRQIIRLSFLPFLLPVAGGAAAPQEESGEGERGLSGRIRWRRDGTSSRHRLLRQLGCDAVRTGCAGVLVYFAFFRFPPIPRTDAMASASVTCRHISGITDDRKGITFEVSSTEGLSAVGRLESLAQENNGGRNAIACRGSLRFPISSKTGKPPPAPTAATRRMRISGRCSRPSPMPPMPLPRLPIRGRDRLPSPESAASCTAGSCPFVMDRPLKHTGSDIQS